MPTGARYSNVGFHYAVMYLNTNVQKWSVKSVWDDWDHNITKQIVSQHWYRRIDSIIFALNLPGL